MKMSFLVLAIAVGAPLSASAIDRPLAPAGEISVASSPAEGMNDAILVQAVLNQFDSALAAHDVDLLQAAQMQPANMKGWRKFFKSNPEATVSDNCPASELEIYGDKANWNCIETVTVMSEGKLLPFAHVIRFTFAKQNGTWMISNRR